MIKNKRSKRDIERIEKRLKNAIKKKIWFFLIYLNENVRKIKLKKKIKGFFKVEEEGGAQKSNI